MNDPLIFILTGHPYHDNSTVLAAFVDQERAISELMRAANPDSPEGAKYEAWVLQAFRGTEALNFVEVHSYNSFFARDEDKCWKPVIHNIGWNLISGGPRLTVVDLDTFDWEGNG